MAPRAGRVVIITREPTALMGAVCFSSFAFKLPERSARSYGRRRRFQLVRQWLGPCPCVLCTCYLQPNRLSWRDGAAGVCGLEARMKGK